MPGIPRTTRRKTPLHVIIPSEAAFVRKVFELYYRGYSYNYIMDKLQVSDVIGR